MHQLNTTMPATGISSEPAPRMALLGSTTNSEINQITRKLQVSSLTRRCAISAEMASVVAALLYSEGRS